MPREKILELLDLLAGRVEIVDAPPLDWTLAERAHDRTYLARWRSGDVTREEERALGFRWVPELVERATFSAGGTVAATRDALARGLGLNLAGGTHHARRDAPGGFGFLNDVATAALHALHDHGVGRVLVLDLDVHQGDGTASIFQDEPRVFTLSVHGEHNYPFRKERSDLDVSLPDGILDDAYLDTLDRTVLPAVEAFEPDLLFYLAGADVLAGDQLGRLALTLDGLRERDRRVYAWAARHRVPVATVLAGGYNRDPDLTIAARVSTVEAALDAFATPRP